MLSVRSMEEDDQLQWTSDGETYPREVSVNGSTGSVDLLEDEVSEHCEDDACDRTSSIVWHCVDCGCSYCRYVDLPEACTSLSKPLLRSGCWPHQGPHRPKKRGRDGIPHEKTDPGIVRRLRCTLMPSRDHHQIERLHKADESTTWFGLGRDAAGRPVLEEFDRFLTLMSDTTYQGGNTTCYPQLVSFIGTTNAGKSTLVKMLVEHRLPPDSLGQFPTPVVGSVVHDSEPTSGDVHLYADASTHGERLPILYADCEGFEGGERVPVGSRARLRTRAHLHQNLPARCRAIEWVDTEESRRREYAVTSLYPRVLYTFSDCVVFVLRNPKTFQSTVLTKLLDWGVAAMETSVNHPSLPQCVIVLNGSDPGVDQREWDVDYATQSLLKSVEGALDYCEGVPRFRELASYWRSLGKHIYTVEDLILRYYSSFKVVRIPAGPSYKMINEQIVRLHEAIRAACEASFSQKRRARMLTNADELSVYLQCGFDHFAAHPDKPFDFMQVSLSRNPIPDSFAGHILELCNALCRGQNHDMTGGLSQLFDQMSVVLASCVLLDCARYRKGKIVELFSKYEEYFDHAIDKYLELYLPCAFTGADGIRKCALVKSRHAQKAHQDESGLIIAVGDYESPLGADFPVRWKQQLRARVESAQRDFAYESEQRPPVALADQDSEVRIALDIHLGHLERFYHTISPMSSIQSHATCFCCVMNVPEHPLPCGHVLCGDCVVLLGRSRGMVVEVGHCPLHPSEPRWARPTILHITPPEAGPRVLSLDGGGILAIVQLEVLRAIEENFGGELPVQAFFDLMIGSDTGGLIAMALTMQDQDVNGCSAWLKSIYEGALIPRLKRPRGLGWFAQAIGRKHCFRTKPFYSALRERPGWDESLFGPTTCRRGGLRAAVTSTTGTGRETILFANYSRPERSGTNFADYSFHRPPEPNLEPKIWQCVAATTAQASSFRPIVLNGKTYQDGGLRYPNPIAIAHQEAQLLWPGSPDLLLSLGAGQDRAALSARLSRHESWPERDNGSVSPHEPRDSVTSSRRWLPGRTELGLPGEIAWKKFKAQVMKPGQESEAKRILRTNPDIGRFEPTKDSSDDYARALRVAREELNKPHQRAVCRNIAHRLIASTFYFTALAQTLGDKDERVISGGINCRFQNGSEDLRAFGRILESRRTTDFEPYFEVRPSVGPGATVHRITLTARMTRGMIEQSTFMQPTVSFSIHDEMSVTSITLHVSRDDGLEPQGFAISKFPRQVVKEALPVTRRSTRSSISTRRTSFMPTAHPSLFPPLSGVKPGGTRSTPTTKPPRTRCSWASWQSNSDSTGQERSGLGRSDKTGERQISKGIHNEDTNITSKLPPQDSGWSEAWADLSEVDQSERPEAPGKDSYSERVDVDSAHLPHPVAPLKPRPRNVFSPTPDDGGTSDPASPTAKSKGSVWRSSRRDTPTGLVNLENDSHGTDPSPQRARDHDVGRVRPRDTLDSVLTLYT